MIVLGLLLLLVVRFILSYSHEAFSWLESQIIQTGLGDPWLLTGVFIVGDFVRENELAVSMVISLTLFTTFLIKHVKNGGEI